MQSKETQAEVEALTQSRNTVRLGKIRAIGLLQNVRDVQVLLTRSKHVQHATQNVIAVEKSDIGRENAKARSYKKFQVKLFLYIIKMNNFLARFNLMLLKTIILVKYGRLMYV